MLGPLLQVVIAISALLPAVYWYLRSQLATERADREEVETQLADLKQKSATAGKDLPEAADLYNQLKTRRKKSSSSLADVEKILEILEGEK